MAATAFMLVILIASYALMFGLVIFTERVIGAPMGETEQAGASKPNRMVQSDASRSTP